MSINIALFEQTVSIGSKVTVASEENLGNVFDSTKFIANFGVLVEADGGGERLRGLVLHLAIRGRLLQQTPLSAEETPKTENLSVPFGLPRGWAWRRVDELGELKLGRQRSPENHTGPNMRPYLRVANVHEARIDTSDVLEMNFEPAEAERFLLKRNDVLLNEGQSYELVGRPAIYRGEVEGACFQNTLIRFRPGRDVLPEFVLVVFRAYMRTGRFRREAQQTTNIAHLSLGRLADIEFPLPPVAEQHRIVAKVDQLMAICDDLEARQTKKRELGTRLTKSALEALTTAEGPEAFDAAWKRVVENFDVLIDRSEKVSEMRSAIFGLACKGAITRRGSGTGAEVLNGVAQRRFRIAKAETIKGNSEVERHVAKLEAQTPAAHGGSLPCGWAWATLLASCVQLVDCHNKTAPYSSAGIMLVRTSNVRDGRIRLEGVKYVTKETYAHWSRRCPPREGDLLFTREAPMGEVGLVEPGMELCMGQRMMLLRVAPDLVDPKYLLLAMRDPAFQKRMVQAAVGSTVKHLRVGGVESLCVPIPPTEEQRAIVARVERLMKVCDDLEAKLRRVEDRAAKLVQAAVEELVA